jgi:EAL domain-containing protein (putative c-di-GMP-specific phosphodiesterase class I)
MEQGIPVDSTVGPLVDFDPVCQRVRAAIVAARVHSVSLLDDRGDVLWMTESSMGPDEHDAAREAFDAFSNPQARPIFAYDLGDSRCAVLFRAVNERRVLAGAIMVVMDTRGIQQDEKGLSRLMTPRMQQVLSEFTAMRPETAPAATSPMPKRRREPPPTPDLDRLNGALRRSPIALHVQRLVPLTKGGQLRRYEVLLRSSAADAPNAAPQAMLKAAVEHGLGSMIDRRVIVQLIAWLVRHPDVWRARAIMLSVNLTSTALKDEHFIQFVGLCLAKSSLPKAMIAFEIDVPTTVTLGERTGVVAAALHRLGCPLVLDNFGLRTECFALLRLPGIRYVKLASEITAAMRTDKLAQAAITAVVQMARVLGMHTVAKHTATAADHEWLTALGVDFVQSNALSPAFSIESLSILPTAKT